MLCNYFPNAKKVSALLFIALLPVHVLAKNSSSKKGCIDAPTTLKVDKVWGGVKVGFSAVESESAIYIGYYDKNRKLTISEIDKCSWHIKYKQLNSTFAGWDAHNYITMVLDSSGRLHVAGNMHVVPLIYARMDKAGDLQSLKLKSQVGSLEDQVTYPVFLKFPDGSLGFSYRSGSSGNGIEVMNRFDGQKWSRWLDEPLFAPAAKGPKINAYHTDFIRGPDNQFHVAWVWRRTPAVETNFNVNYAHSPDLRTWYSSQGKKITLPITPENADVAAQIPMGNGLFNNIRLGFDNKRRPIISYLKFDMNGNSQLWHARYEKNNWKNYQSTNWSYRWDPRGYGTIRGQISFSGVKEMDGMLLERVNHPDVGVVTLNYDEDSLRETQIIKNNNWLDSLPKVNRKAWNGLVLSVAPVKSFSGDSSQKHVISWISYPAGNGDKPYECKTEGGCSYIYDLELNNF